jgi:hypothetical protein
VIVTRWYQRYVDDDDVQLNIIQHGSGLQNLFSVSFHLKIHRSSPIRGK